MDNDDLKFMTELRMDFLNDSDEEFANLCSLMNKIGQKQK